MVVVDFTAMKILRWVGRSVRRKKNVNYCCILHFIDNRQLLSSLFYPKDNGSSTALETSRGLNEQYDTSRVVGEDATPSVMAALGVKCQVRRFLELTEKKVSSCQHPPEDQTPCPHSPGSLVYAA